MFQFLNIELLSVCLQANSGPGALSSKQIGKYSL